MVSGRFGNSAQGTTQTYTYILYTSGFIHHTTLTGLAPNTRYFYRVGDVATGFSQEFSFMSHPGVGPTMSYTFGVVGDLGQTTYSNNTIWHMVANSSIQSIIHPGDLSYADGDQTRWDSWGRLAQPLAATKPWMVAAGNHEVESWFSQEFTAYNARFQMPSVNPYKNASGNLFYSFEVGPVHVLVLCTYYNFTQGSPQYEFAMNDLKSISRARTPWVVSLVHAPWYNSNEVHQGEGDAMMAVFEDAFYGNVDIVFAGHVHAYERCYQTYKAQRDPKAPLYITIGDGGNREGLYDTWIDPQPVWSAFRQAAYGHGVLQVTGTTATWTWHTIDTDEPVASDQITLTKSA